jgi:hypothetical protein
VSANPKPKRKPKLGNCFETAMGLVLGDPTMTLVHGLVHHDVSGEHWHAWAERTEEVHFPGYGPVTMTSCIDHANGNHWEGPAALYYSIGRIKTTHRYDDVEAAKEMLRTGHYGPWVDWEGKP